MSVACFCSVIYPGNLIFLDSFLKSLENQTDKEFTLLLFNDGIESLDFYLNDFELKCKIIQVSGTIINIRTQVFNYLKNSEYTNTIFGDTDDYFPENRVSVNKLLLEENDVVANDLCLVTEQEEKITGYYWKDREELKGVINLSSITKYNFLGLGNTAIRTSVLPKNVVFDEKTIAVDWLLFTRILMNDVKVCFTSDTFIYYRQHENNTIGRKKITLEEFKKGFAVKLNHYIALAKENVLFEKEARLYQESKLKVEKMTPEDINYNLKNKNPFWWEEIQI